MFLVLMLALVSSGCGVKLAYNNGDRLVRWWVDDYIDMTSEQRRYLRGATNDLLHWHRTHELAGYRRVFLQLADDLEAIPAAAEPLVAVGSDASTQQILTTQELQNIVNRVEQWGERIGERAVPIAVQMLLSLTPQQRQEFAANIEEENAEYLEEAQQDAGDRVAEMAKDYRKFMARLVGRLTPTQRQLVLQRHTELLIFETETVAYRRQWLQQIDALLSMEIPDQKKLAELLWLDEEDYPANFQAVFDANEMIYRQLTLDLVNSLNYKQRQRFADRLRTLARICEELIDETGAAPGAPRPLVMSSWRVQRWPFDRNPEGRLESTRTRWDEVKSGKTRI